MNEIEKSNSSSDVSSNSSWTFLEDAEKNKANSSDELVDIPAEVQSIEPPEHNSSSSHQVKFDNGEQQKIVKQKVENTRSSTLNLYNTLQNRSYIGTLTIVGTVLALTGLSFLCLLLPATNTSPVLMCNPMVNVSNFSSNVENHVFPIYENEKGDILIDDQNGFLANQLKEGLKANETVYPKASNDRHKKADQTEDIMQYPETLADSIKPKVSDENDAVAIKDLITNLANKTHSVNVSEKGNTPQGPNNINFKNYIVSSESVQVQHSKQMEKRSKEKIKDKSENVVSKEPSMHHVAATKELENSAKEVDVIKNTVNKETDSDVQENIEIKRSLPEKANIIKPVKKEMENKTTKEEKNALNMKKQEENRRRCNVEYMNRRSIHSRRCCGSRPFTQRKPLQRKPCPTSTEPAKSIKNQVSYLSAYYSEFLVHCPNIKTILHLFHDILLLKMLNRIRGTRSYTDIKKKIESSYHNVYKAVQHKQEAEEPESVESIAEFSLKRLFEDEDQFASEYTERAECIPDSKELDVNSEKSLHCPERESTISLQQTAKHTCKCYKNHATSEITNRKVRKMLEEYERMITCDNKKEHDICKHAVCTIPQESCKDLVKDKNKSICFNDVYDCECKFSDLGFFRAHECNRIAPEGDNTLDSSECAAIEGQNNSEDLSSAVDINNILDHIVSEALENIRRSYSEQECDSNDEQNHADDEQSSDSETECKQSNTTSTTVCRKTTKGENMNYLLLFGKSKSQLRKKDVHSLHCKDQQNLTRKGLMSKQEPEKAHIDRVIKHYRILQ